MEAPGLHETNFNTQCYNDAIDLELLDGRSVLDKLFFQNEVQRVLYKLVLVAYPLDNCCRIYSPSNFRFSQKTKKSNLFL